MNSSEMIAVKIDELARAALLPPLDWHINNLLQLSNHLHNLKAPDLQLVILNINHLSENYSAFLNSYDKKERIDYLSWIRMDAISLSREIAARNTDHSWNIYKAECAEPYAINGLTVQIEGQKYMSFERYFTEAKRLILAVHDFALGLAAVCLTTNAEPYKEIYNTLEKST